MLPRTLPDPEPRDPWRRLPRTRTALEEGLDEGLHLGAQLCVSLRGEVVADAALGENRPGEPLTPEHLMLWLSATSMGKHHMKSSKKTTSTTGTSGQ